MSFSALVQSAERLRAALYASTGRDLVVSVSLEGPGEQTGEVAFIKAVLWCYALWVEACQPVGRYLASAVRSASQEDHKTASRAFQNVQNLRTFLAHNLDKTSNSDQRKVDQAKIWLAQNGGAGGDWDNCTNNLCSDLAQALDILREHWIHMTADPQDAAMAVPMLLRTIDREWEPHLFDEIIGQVCVLLDLQNFDVVRYRTLRLAQLQETVGLFENRADADAAARRAIYRELFARFGKPGEAIVAAEAH